MNKLKRGFSSKKTLSRGLTECLDTLGDQIDDNNSPSSGTNGEVQQLRHWHTAAYEYNNYWAQYHRYYAAGEEEWHHQEEDTKQLEDLPNMNEATPAVLSKNEGEVTPDTAKQILNRLSALEKKLRDMEKKLPVCETEITDNTTKGTTTTTATTTRTKSDETKYLVESQSDPPPPPATSSLDSTPRREGGPRPSFLASLRNDSNSSSEEPSPRATPLQVVANGCGEQNSCDSSTSSTSCEEKQHSENEEEVAATAEGDNSPEMPEAVSGADDAEPSRSDSFDSLSMLVHSRRNSARVDRIREQVRQQMSPSNQLLGAPGLPPARLKPTPMASPGPQNDFVNSPIATPRSHPPR